MKIQNVTIYQVDLPLKFTFHTAAAVLNHRETLILKVTDCDGNVGFGETVSFSTPFYTQETLYASLQILREEYVPAILGKEISHPFELHSRIGQQFPMAASGLEMALFDLYAKKQNQSIVASVFGEKLRSDIEMGIVIGDIPAGELLEKIREYELLGCRRFKIKIKPEDGYERVKKAVEQFPGLQFAVDANRSYSIAQLRAVKRFDGLNLLCMEEPFQFSEVEECRNMQFSIQTPICLDESIQNFSQLERAVSCHAFQVLNLKVGKSGGLFYVKQMIAYCRKNRIRYWIGSMVESGISKMLHVQLAGLTDTYMAGDLSDSRRYFETDLIRPEISFTNGSMKFPQRPGLGVVVDENILSQKTVHVWKMEG